MIGAMMIVPFMDALAKLLSSRYPVLQLVWARFFFHFLLVFPIAWVRHRGHVFRAPRPVLQIGRGLCLMGATLCFFGAIRTIPLADAIALIFFDAVLVVLLSALLLNERVPTGRAIASVLGLVGVVLIVQPGFGNFQWESLLALAAAFFFRALFFVDATAQRQYASDRHAGLARRRGFRCDERARAVYLGHPKRLGSWFDDGSGHDRRGRPPAFDSRV